LILNTIRSILQFIIFSFSAITIWTKIFRIYCLKPYPFEESKALAGSTIVVYMFFMEPVVLLHFFVSWRSRTYSLFRENVSI